MSSIDILSDQLAALVASLAPGERKKLALAIGRKIAAAQRARIALQQDADGAAFAPRARPSPEWSGKRKKKVRAMFAKLRRTKWLKVEAKASRVLIGWTGSAGRIAHDHQTGLRTRKFRLPRRTLLGFGASDRQMIFDVITEHLARAV